MELEKNSDPDEDDDEDEDDKDDGVETGGGGKIYVAGKKPGYGMKTKPTVTMMQDNASTAGLRAELKMTGGLPDLGNI